jgi:predicted HD phosphohydrolase
VNTPAQVVTPVDRILELLHQSGAHQYGGEAVSQLTHALQTAELAENEGADDELILASLLHDLGHLLSPIDLGVETEIDPRDHERLGARLLHGTCAPRIVWLVEHHADAKRYLCAVFPQYTYQLSPVSRQSLVDQGGPMSATERLTFVAHPWAMDAVRLRRWDDRAKVPNWKPLTLDHFEDRLREHFGRCWSLTCRSQITMMENDR